MFCGNVPFSRKGLEVAQLISTTVAELEQMAMEGERERCTYV
jgi:hypothetical protein